jgi:Mce-associated membrane protein
MPSGKKLRATASETPAPVDDEVPVEESADDVEPTTSSIEETPAAETPTAETPTEETPTAETPTAETPTEKGRRRGFLRRGKTQPAAAQAAEPADAGAPAEETAGETVEPVSTDAEATEPKEDESAAQETVLVAHRPAGKRLKIVAAAAAALFVAGAAFLGASAQPVIANRALVETKLNIAATAANAITTLWSYTPENMDSLGERSARYLTGDFAAQYKKFIDSIVATNKQAQVTNTTSVLGTAVESVTPTDASAVVYTNSVATSPVSKNIPSLRYLSYRLEMKRDRAEWRITRMTTVTTLDLTPQL